MACPNWLFSSIFKILEENLLICLFPSIVTSISAFSVFGSFASMPVSKASLVFTQLKPPIRVFSKTLINSSSIGRAIQHLLLLRCTHPEKLLALLHFLGLYVNICFNNSDLFSDLWNLWNQRIIVSWKLYNLFNSPKLDSFKSV